MAKNEALAAALLSDYRTAAIDEADRTMLRYVEKLSKTPGRMCAADVEELHRAGFCDRAITDICQTAAYYAFVNRIADGLGVELEPWMK